MKRTLAALALLAPLTAQAAIIGIVRTAGGQLELHDTAGPCVAGALSVVYRPAKPSREPVHGCWTVRVDKFVYMVFLDGDFVRVPSDEFRKPETT